MLFAGNNMIHRNTELQSYLLKNIYKSLSIILGSDNWMYHLEQQTVFKLAVRKKIYKKKKKTTFLNIFRTVIFWFVAFSFKDKDI